MWTYLWSSHKVHLQKPGLEGSLCRSVILEGVQEEGGTLLDHVLLHEHVHDLVDVGQRLVILNKHLSKLGSSLGIGPAHK